MEALEKRIGRIVGQMRGIQRMVNEKRDNVEVLQQVSAVKKAIDGLSREIIYRDLDESFSPKQIEKLKKTIDRAIDL